jgi:hypothetical protein
MATAKKSPAKAKTERVDKSYRLLKYSPLTFELKTGRNNNLIVFDPETEDTRAIKHCPNEKSIFVDEQSKLGVVKSIVFVNGVYNVKATDVRTQQFLDIHPSNGIIFEEINQSADAQEMLEWEDLILDMKTEIRKKAREENGIEEIRVLVSALTSDISGTANLSAPELRYAAFELVESNPDRFLNDDGEISIFDDSDITRKAISNNAFASGVVTLSPDARQILWSDNKAPICSVPRGKGYSQFFADYLKTDDGIEVMKELSKR